MRFKNTNRVKINLIVLSIYIIHSVVISTPKLHNKLSTDSIFCTKNVILFDTNLQETPSHINNGGHDICNCCEIEDWISTEKVPRNLLTVNSLFTIFKLGKHQKYHLNYLPRAPPA